jgi:Cft2 family RNA processing exonuclease
MRRKMVAELNPSNAKQGIAVTATGGLHLTEHDLWLDPHRAKAIAYVSHGHSDHTARHKAVFCTPETAAIMRQRLGSNREERTASFGTTHELLGGNATLLSAGHVLGAAQLFFESNAGSLLYTGDFKMRHGLSVPPATFCKADTLIMETTFGIPKYRMPPSAEILAQIVEWCRESLETGVKPVLFAYSLGKAQELVCALVAAGLSPMLHDAAWKICEIYREFAPAFPTSYRRWKPSESEGQVIIWPHSRDKAELSRRFGKHRAAAVTGWAVDPSAKYRYGCDAAFPLSDHADYDELLQAVELVQPSRVLTVHGFASEFAADLRRRGVEAWALTQENQLELQLA